MKSAGTGRVPNLLEIGQYVLLGTGGLTVVFFAFLELALSFPLPGPFYLMAAIFLLMGALPSRNCSLELIRIAAVTTALAILATLYFVEWTSRKPFLRDLRRIEAGMTERDVFNIMDRYIQGTGWPANPFSVGDSGPNQREVTSPQPLPELRISNSVVFRHSTNSAFNSDWGIVTFADGKVIKVEFSAD